MARLIQLLKKKPVDAERQERFLAFVGKGLNRTDAAALAGIVDIATVLNDDPILKMRVERARAQLKLDDFETLRRHAQADPSTAAKVCTMFHPECRGESEIADHGFQLILRFQPPKESSASGEIVQTQDETRSLNPPNTPAIIDRANLAD